MNLELAYNILKNYGGIEFCQYKWLSFARKLALTDPFKAEWLNFKRSYDKKGQSIWLTRHTFRKYVRQLRGR